MADVTASTSEQDLSFFRAEICCFGPVHDPELASKDYNAGQGAFDNKNPPVQSTANAYESCRRVISSTKARIATHARYICDSIGEKLCECNNVAPQLTGLKLLTPPNAPAKTEAPEKILSRNWNS